MSADNWAVCPKCAAAKVAEATDLRDKANKQYGKASIDTWLELDAAARKAFDALPLTEATMREDYDIGIYEGEFGVDYRAACMVCKFSHSFKAGEAVS